jgi:amicyanin
MKKSTIAIIVAVILLAIGGVIGWIMINKDSSPSTGGNATAPDSQVTDMTSSKNVAVTMRDLSFSPPSIKIKKGTTVTWTNQDSVGHNVIADDAPDRGGLPTSHDLLTRGETQSVTFVRVGTFKYHCGAHAFMKGTVQVVD